MEIFSNWIFWVVLASIVFVLFLIGYLTESMKKDKKDDKKKEESTNVPDVSTPVTSEPAEVNVAAQNDDWTVMPKTEAPLGEVKVDTISEVTSDQNNVDNLFTSPVNNQEAVSSEPVTIESQELNVEAPVMSNDSALNDNSTASTIEVQNTNASVDTAAPVETLNTDDSQTEKNSDIWNL